MLPEPLKTSRYNLVLMDMQMPVMGGYAATRAIRQWERDQRLPETPIVALTALALRLLGHRMRGDGGGYGFHAISEIGTALEHASARRDAGEIRRLAIALLEFLERVEVVYER